MSRKLYLFEQQQKAIKIQNKRTDKIRYERDNNINIKLQPWITKQKS